MKQKENFVRLSIEDMKTLKAQQELQKVVDQAMFDLDARIEEECEKLADFLVNEEGLDVDDFTIEVENKWQGGKLLVHLKVVCVGKTIEFDFNNKAI
ncbi:hypothetical protein HV417_02045 [Bacillus sporothermodurans]|uniref:hypothetical protein n=1 Tax=Heyndrickxia sporothermodurans TaxID=46224 RepID=UPI00192B4F40|nr:hypothetical protein [Heyndrickxia sporothermodurans]MBL5872344.1 hypothetical protein [Heyndrickxia sporothermodurans]